MKSANNYSPNKLKAEVDRLKTEVDRLNKITNKLEEENESRKKYFAGEAHKLITDMRICEEDIKWRRKFLDELEKERQKKMLNLFGKENK